MSTSADWFGQTYEVIPLHQVLFAELGEWTGESDLDSADLAAYRSLAEKSRTARAVWIERSKAKKKNASECEAACDAMIAAEAACLDPLYNILHRHPRSALCFSGGGIRSATFSLGVLHALAKYSFAGEPGDKPPRLLAEFDYISTVSGGGYIGSWLSSWIAREGSTEKVVRQLAQTPAGKLDPEPKPLAHLRDYSNYLNPHLGFASADTWTLAATALRNILLNWLVLIPFLAAALLLPELFRRLLDTPPIDSWPLLAAGFGLGVLGTGFLMLNLPSFGNRQDGERKFLLLCLAPLSLCAFCLTSWWRWQPAGETATFPHLYFVYFGAAMHTAGVLLGTLLSLGSKSVNFQKGHLHFGRLMLAYMAAVITGGLGGWLLAPIATRFHGPAVDVATYACFGVPLVSATLAVVGVVSVGVSSKITEDDDREWWSRAGAWVLILSVSWICLATLVLLVPRWIAELSMKWQLSFSTIGAALGWYATKAGASGNNGPVNRGDQSAQAGTLPSKVRGWLIPGAAVLFLIALAFGVTVLNKLMEQMLGQFGGGLIFLELALAVLASYAININKFSLHAMYRMRLIRAYLGASNTKRKPNPFTGFDPADNLEMRNLSATKPLHVLNLCLNLVGGSKLAWQQRKAESFTVTRLHSGSFRVGYQPSATYGSAEGAGGITLGTAMTISGAAASPNMGYHSSPLAAIVMTLFNARLGWWLANPGEPGTRFWNRSGPVFGIRPFLDEAFGKTNDTNRYVYLSDGGHFENLGLYEMVVRRCRFIVVVDAGADPEYTKEDLGNAVRKIRIDLGVPIEFPSGIPIDPALGVAARHCAIGEIRYDCVDRDAKPGTLLYLKPVLNGNEPADVLHYQAANRTFPQQPTADQWFDESQFESYRRLGAHSVEEILGESAQSFGLEDLMRAAREYVAADRSGAG
jgi:patatin-like phospholipase